MANWVLSVLFVLGPFGPFSLPIRGSYLNPRGPHLARSRGSYLNPRRFTRAMPEHAWEEGAWVIPEPWLPVPFGGRALFLRVPGSGGSEDLLLPCPLRGGGSEIPPLLGPVCTKP